MDEHSACASCVPSEDLVRRMAVRSCPDIDCPYVGSCPLIGSVSGCECVSLIVPSFLTLRGVEFRISPGEGRKATFLTDGGIVDGVCRRIGQAVTAVVPFGAECFRMVTSSSIVKGEKVLFLR